VAGCPGTDFDLEENFYYEDPSPALRDQAKGKAMPHLVRLAIGIMVLLASGSWARAADEAFISGRLSVRDRQGQVVYGDWVRVYLVREAIALPTIPAPDPGNRMARREWINDVHMAFFIGFREKMEKVDYLVDFKLTRADGTFAFDGVPPGSYQVLVTHPTIINLQKCAWQVPVTVAAGEHRVVELNADNQALPGF